MSCVYVDRLLAGLGWNHIYSVLPPDDEQQTCLKHVEVNY